MNTKVIQAFRIPSLLLAAVLQFMPMVRAALPAMQSASNLFAIIFRWGGAAAAALGSVQAVSGASTVITLGNVTATNGMAITNKLLTSPQTAGWWSVSGAPPGIGLIGSGSSSKLGGVPTATGVYSVALVAKSSASANSSETTSKTITYTVVANTGGGGGGGASNSPPVANAQSVSTAEDTAKAITLTGTDANGNPLTYAIVASPAHGTLTGTAPNVTYTPAANYNGADSFTFRANDGLTNSATATVTITVTAVNDAPVASAQSVSTPEDTAKAITLSSSDVDGNALTYAIVALPAHGTLTGTGASRTYTPAANYNGADSFTFKANDGSVDSATAAVSITVSAVNDAPVATAQSVATDKNVAKNITLAGTDADGNALTFTVVAQPTKGILSGTAPNLTYTPNNNVTGADSFTFKANDGTVDSATATVAITIAAGANTAPVANAQSITVNEDATMLVTLVGSDADGNALTYAVVTPPAHGTLSGTAPNFYYKPATNFNGSDTFWFKANDGTVDSAAAVVSITVSPVNDAPVASAQNVTTPQDTAKSITLIASDVDGDALTFTITSAPAHGTLSGTAPNLTYTPATGYSGSDTLWFKANDGTADSALAVVSITVNATTTPSTNLSTVSVVAGANASEPHNVGSFLFTRTGNSTKSLTLYFTLDGSAEPGVDYANPGNKITFPAGRTNAALLIKPIADKIFEGSKTVVLSLIDSTNFDIGELDSAAILVGDDDRPRISISAPRPVTDDEDRFSPRAALRSTAIMQAKVHAAAYAGFSLLLQCSTDLTNWMVVAAPPLEQPIDYVNLDPTGTKTCYYRALYVNGAITEAGVAEAVAHQMFSANIVGVVNVGLQPGWNLAANPLDGSPQDGPLGNLPDGTVFVPFKSSKENVCKEGRWSRNIPLTRSTMGGWLYNPSSEPVTITYLGELPDPSNKPQLRAGWNVRSSAIDTTVGNDTLLGYPLYAGDALYEFNPSGTGADMWIAYLRTADGWNILPTLSAGRGVLIYKTKSTRPSAVATHKPPTPNLIRFVPMDDEEDDD